MQDSQLIDIIKTFSRDEMGELRLFVRSPYFILKNEPFRKSYRII